MIIIIIEIIAKKAKRKVLLLVSDLLWKHKAMESHGSASMEVFHCQVKKSQFFSMMKIFHILGPRTIFWILIF